MSEEHREFPEGMTPLGSDPFQFKCHPGVSCFTVCCNKVDLILFPYDLIRLKRALGIQSSELLDNYTSVIRGNNPYFPSILLKLTDEGKGKCPFLGEAGCSVYEHRPYGCRMYPLERAVDRTPVKGRFAEHYFVVKHDYCKGHEEEGEFTSRQWVRDQKLQEFNTYNELWTEIDSLFMDNPWKGEGAGGPGQQLAFMICYNLDGFRSFVEERDLLSQFRLNRQQRRGIEERDEELLKFGFEWLKMLFGGRSSLVRK